MPANLDCLHVYNNNSLVSLTHLCIYIYIYTHIVCLSVSGHLSLSGPSNGPCSRSSSAPARLYKFQFWSLIDSRAAVVLYNCIVLFLILFFNRIDFKKLLHYYIMYNMMIYFIIKSFNLLVFLLNCYLFYLSVLF